MSLVGDWVYPVAIVSVLVSLAFGTVATRFTSRHKAWWLFNLLIVTLTSALVAVSGVLVLNRDNGWFATWDDLMGAMSPAGQAAPQPAERDDADTPPATPKVDEPSAKPAPLNSTERVQVFQVPTSVGHETWPVTVVFPEEYFTPEAAGRSYPVVMAGHGVPGSMGQWTSPAIDIRNYLDPLVAQKKVAPTLFVIPSITPGGKDTGCIFGPGGPDQIETWLAKDVPTFLKAQLRVLPQRTAWAWIGVSGGAWCGAMVTMRHPDTFQAAIVLGGYFKPDWAVAPPFPKNSDVAKGYDLIALTQNRPPDVALWVQTSKTDKESYQPAQAIIAAAKPPLKVTLKVDDHGGHLWTSWRPHVPTSLLWLASVSPDFAARK